MTESDATYNKTISVANAYDRVSKSYDGSYLDPKDIAENDLVMRNLSDLGLCQCANVCVLG